MFRLIDLMMILLRDIVMAVLPIVTTEEVIYSGEGNDATYKEPQAYLGVHVDDILLIGLDEVCTSTKASLCEVFPIPEWETGSIEYVGSFVDVGAEEIKVSQTGYVKTRLFEIEVDKDQKDWETATEIQRHDNMSLMGALSWLSSQTRPDLQVGSPTPWLSAPTSITRSSSLLRYEIRFLSDCKSLYDTLTKVWKHELNSFIMRHMSCASVAKAAT
ncbi:GIP, partial [Symbiodinium microadriaticum]